MIFMPFAGKGTANPATILHTTNWQEYSIHKANGGTLDNFPTEVLPVTKADLKSITKKSGSQRLH